MPDGLDIAVVGSGISGMSCAWLLSAAHRVSVFEAGPRIGGHTNTVMVDGTGIDTGFIVYNEATYPNLTALFRHLGVATQPSDMSFAVSLDDGALEYAGTDLAGLFAQRRNLLRPRFWSMLRDIARFYREAPGHVAALERDGTTLGAFLAARGYGAALRDDHLLPMAAAVWSGGTARARDIPAAGFIRFCDNHGLLKLSGRPEWRSVRGGGGSYVGALTAPYAARIQCDAKVVSLRRDPDGVALRTEDGRVRRFDHVVLATSAPRALAVLDDAGAEERAVLSRFRVSRNLAVLHTDPTLMPRRRAVWSSWNYLGRRGDADEVCVSYWMNRLQALTLPLEYFVTLNPPRPPAAGMVLHSETYEHPVFDMAAAEARRAVWSLQGARRTWFCGAWFGAGFHEDGLQAGLAVAEQLGGVARPWRVPDPSGRIHLGAAPSLPLPAEPA
jgi:predicted NAD/FAD-binding protein